jgi:hypothetical protein
MLSCTPTTRTEAQSHLEQDRRVDPDKNLHSIAGEPKLRRQHKKKKPMKTTILICLALLAGCSTAPQTATLATMTLTNELGHVIGRRDIVQHRQTRETWSNFVLYEPLLGPRGEVIGYEETVGDGTIRYALNGRKVGGTLKDLRSGSSFGVVVRRD